MSNVLKFDDSEVVLISGGGRVFTDMAARFVKSDRSLTDIISSDYDANIVRNILDSGHLAATEFDYFIFGINGFSRVCETQLVRKRIASYIIKSGRCEQHGKRPYDVVIPPSLLNAEFEVQHDKIGKLPITLTTADIIDILSQVYESGITQNIPEEDLRYIKPEGTNFKAIIGMNAHALLDWFRIRTCSNAQLEIRTLARKMMALCKDAAPDLFRDAGPNCKVLGYCPEGERQCSYMKGIVPTKNDVFSLIDTYYRKGL